MSNPIPFVWTNDDITCGKYDQMARQLEFLSRFDLKGTFFVVPCPNGGQQELTDDPKLVDLLRQVMQDGHEAHQHSTTHVCEENGTADLRMFDLMGDAAKVDYSYRRFVLERLWQVDALAAQIEWGRRVWTDAFGAPSDGFRPGCGAFCGNMYQALEQLGFRWVSSRLASATGWMWQAGQYDYPLRLEGPVLPFRQTNIIEFPILDDVAFRVPQDKVDDFVELGWRLWTMCVEQGYPFVLCSHWHGLERAGGTGYAVHEKLLPRILDSGDAIPLTLGEYYQGLVSGRFPTANPENVYPGPDQIPEWHALARDRRTT